MKKSLFIACLPFFIIGCDSASNINALKNIIPNVDKTNTIGGILDNRDICQKVEWIQFVDDKSRPIVQYQCFLKLDSTLEKASDSFKQKETESINRSVKGALEKLNLYNTRKNKRQESITHLTSLYHKFKDSPDIMKIRESGRSLLQLCQEISQVHYNGNNYSCYTKINIDKLRESNDSDAQKYIDAINNLIEQNKLYSIDNKDYVNLSREWPNDPRVNYSDDAASDIFIDLFNNMTEPSRSESGILQHIQNIYTTTSIDREIVETEEFIKRAPQKIKSLESIKYLDFIETVQWSTININEPMMFKHTLCITEEKDNIKSSK